MADSYSNNTSQDTSCNNSNATDCSDHHSNNTDYSNERIEKDGIILFLVTCIVLCVGLPLTLVAIRAVYSQVRNDHVASIYIINLLISDVFQFCFMIVRLAEVKNPIISDISTFMYFFGVTSSVCFMVCIAMERYLVIAWPLWYRCRRTIKFSVVVCVVVWAISLVLVMLFLLHHVLIVKVFFLLPFPLMIFFLVGTLKALSAAISVPSDEKRRIVAVLVTVLLIYMLLFLPIIILAFKETVDGYFDVLSFVILSPLADLFLYVVMRKGAVDKLLASLCCCRMDSDDTDRSAV